MGKKTEFRVTPGDAWQRGVRETENGYYFSVAIPDGAEAELLLYTDPGQARPCQVIPLPEEERFGEVSAVTVEMPHDGTWAYAYRINGRICPDRYADNIRGRLRPETGQMEFHALTAPPAGAKTKPLDIAYEDAVIYKAHVRGLTRKGPGGIRHPGTFQGICECIPYLQELGVNMLMLMPCYEFADSPKTGGEYPLDGELRVLSADAGGRRKNYWGYVPGMYLAPKLRYCAGDDPCREFADMMDALHEAGIGCIPEFYFDASEDPRFVTDVLRHWLLHYRVDGFHLIGDGGWTHAAAADPVLKKTWILHTGFDASAVGLRKPRNGRKTLGIYNLSFEHTMRRFLKGDTEVPPEEAAWMLRRSDADCGMLNYFADQDGFTMADMVSFEERHNEANGEGNRDGSHTNFTWNCGEEGPTRKTAIRKRREQQLRNAWLMLLTAQGTPLLYAGDEALNTQNGNNNAWCQDNETGWVTWKKTNEARRMTEFVRQAIAFRAAHPVLRQAMPLRMADYKASGFPDVSYHSQIAWMSQAGQIRAGLGVMYSGAYAVKPDGTADDTLYIAYNMYWMPQSFALPDLPPEQCWKVVCDTSCEEGFCQEPKALPAGAEGEKLLPVPPRSILVLTACRKDTEPAERTPEKKSGRKTGNNAGKKPEKKPEKKSEKKSGREMKEADLSGSGPDQAGTEPGLKGEEHARI